jgi:hypothetical protein
VVVDRPILTVPDAFRKDLFESPGCDNHRSRLIILLSNIDQQISEAQSLVAKIPSDDTDHERATEQLRELRETFFLTGGTTARAVFGHVAVSGYCP